MRVNFSLFSVGKDKLCIIYVDKDRNIIDIIEPKEVGRWRRKITQIKSIGRFEYEALVRYKSQECIKLRKLKGVQIKKVKNLERLIFRMKDHTSLSSFRKPDSSFFY